MFPIYSERKGQSQGGNLALDDTHALGPAH